MSKLFLTILANLLYCLGKQQQSKHMIQTTYFTGWIFLFICKGKNFLSSRKFSQLICIFSCYVIVFGQNA